MSSGFKTKNKIDTDELQLFEKLLIPIYTDLYRFILSIIRDEYLAEDILQETTIIAYKNFHTLKDKAKFKTWCFTIAKRKAMNMRKKTIREILMTPEQYQNLIKTAIFEDSPDIMTHIAIAEAIKTLPTEYRNIINLVYGSNLSLKDTAQIMKTNYNTVKSKHRRALQKIRQTLKASVK